MSQFIKGTNELIKEVNIINILHIAKKHGPISTSDLSKITGLTPVTVLKSVKKLLAAGYIIEKGYGESNGGRKPILIDFNPDNKYIIAVNINSEKITIALTNLGAKIIKKVVKDINVEDGLKSVTSELKKVMNTFINTVNKSDVLGIGISFPGPVDPIKNRILFSPNITGSENFYLQQEIEEEFGLLTRVENNANAAALGEKIFGKGIDIKNLVYINVDTGIGSGIIIDGHIYHGRGSAGEIGHMVIDVNGEECNCGNYGCLETISSGRALVKKAKRDVKLGIDSELSNLSPDKINLDNILKSVQSGDDYAQKILNESALYMGVGFCNIVNLFNPDVVIIGGRIPLNYPSYNDVITRVEERRLNKVLQENVRIEVPTFEDAYLIGASALLVHELLALPTKSKNEDVSLSL